MYCLWLLTAFVVIYPIAVMMQAPLVDPIDLFSNANGLQAPPVIVKPTIGYGPGGRPQVIHQEGQMHGVFGLGRR